MFSGPSGVSLMAVWASASECILKFTLGVTNRRNIFKNVFLNSNFYAKIVYS